MDIGTEPKKIIEADAPGRRSLVDTWIEVFADAGGLVRTEARLARIEVSENVGEIGRHSIRIGAGVLLLSLAAIFVTVAAVVALATFMGLLWALLLVAAVCGIGGYLLFRAGISGVSAASLLPDKALSRMSRDLGSLSERAPAPDTQAGGKQDQQDAA